MKLPVSRKKIMWWLDTISGAAFAGGLSGTLISKLQYFIAASRATLLTQSFALAFYMIGYLAWFAQTLINPLHHQAPYWYGFATLKQQFGIASLLGIAAAMVGISAMFIPILIIPSSCLFMLSNIFWCIGEYHKKAYPLQSPNYSAEKQAHYFQYVAITSCVNIISTILTNISFFIPAIIPYAIVLNLLMGIIIVKALYDAVTFIPSKETDSSEHPRPTALAELSRRASTVIPKTEPVHTPSLFDTQSDSDRLDFNHTTPKVA